MSIIEAHTSNDGLLKLVVCRAADGDTAIGFASFPWHTHADILASSSGPGEPEAIRRFIDDVLNDRAIIAVSRTNGVAKDVWVTEVPASELRYQRGDETIEFRYWSGELHS